MKMGEHRLSKRKVLNVFLKPERIEEGIAQNTSAAMQKDKKGEIWVMYQDVEKEKKIIAAWRYPGESLKVEEIY